MHIRPVGTAALLIEVDDVLGWIEELTLRRDRGEFTADEIVTGARTILIDGLADTAGLAEAIRQWPPPILAAQTAGRLVRVPTAYDGPDLADVANRWRMTIDEAISVYERIEFRVAFFGFAPGFAYLSGLPDDLAVPRHETPRTRVPAGSVAIADTFAAIYPAATPGGWRLIGRTDLQLFDVHRVPPATLAVGDRVRFMRVQA